jgi:hypothetical protein
MTNEPNLNTNEPVASADQDGHNPQDQTLDFDQWLENELVILEEKFNDFATTNSNRRHFSR